MRKAVLFLVSFMSVMAASAQAQTSIEGILQNSPVACFYMLMRTYHRQLAVCQEPLNDEAEQRFSRMTAAMEDYILRNARLDPAAIIENARGAAERIGEVVPACGSGAYEETKEAMLNLTSAESEALLYAQLETNALPANGSCY